MSELIRLFRDHVLGKIAMREERVGGTMYYVFGEAAYSASTPTSLKSLDNTYYTLESIINLWQNRDMPHTNYVRQVSQRSVTAVTLLQRKHLLDYLTGKTDELQGNDQHAPVALPTSLAALREQEKERAEPKAKRPRIEESDETKKHDEANKQIPMEVDDQSKPVEGIRAKLSLEKIEQLRNKVQQNLKYQTKTQTISSHPEESADPLADLPFADAGDSCTKLIQESEIPSSSRASLYSSTSNFEAINSYFIDIKSKSQPASQANGHPTAAAGAAPSSQGRNNRQAAGYSRYDQEVFRSEPEADFQIETNLSFHGTSFNAIRGGGLNSTNLNDSSSSQPLTDSNSPVDVRKRNGNSQPMPPPSRDLQPKPGFGPPNAINPNGRPPKKVSRTPIIIIPASGTALITMYNAVDILEHLRYVPTEQRKKEIRRESDLLIHRRKPDGTTVPYRVIDDPRKLRDEEWDRIVAVFVQGPAWQFKGWKYNQQPTEIFSKICAFHMKFDEQPLDKNVAGWSVRVLSLSQQKRHLDRAVLHGFWNAVDAFMVKNKPFLRF